MNGIWVGLGRLSTGEKVASTLLVGVLVIAVAAGLIRRVADRNWVGAGIALVVGIAAVFVLDWLWNWLDPEALRIVVGVVLTLVLVGLLAALAQALVKQTYARAVLPGVMVLLLGWFLIRYWQIIGGGVGGQRINSGGRQVPSPINFIQEPPFNNMWLMVVLIWIQTGFAMVILSAAIKAVPTELIEAAKVDGATTSQVFWRVTLPQVGTTIGVVVTTLMVLVMKVYDIVQVLTNGNFGTQVLANNMFNETFSNRDFGIGSALAMLIFVSVLPIIYMNIRRMQKEA
jgi:alpha-glucoside transport system permease protein